LDDGFKIAMPGWLLELGFYVESRARFAAKRRPKSIQRRPRD